MPLPRPLLAVPALVVLLATTACEPDAAPATTPPSTAWTASTSPTASAMPTTPTPTPVLADDVDVDEVDVDIHVAPPPRVTTTTKRTTAKPAPRTTTRARTVSYANCAAVRAAGAAPIRRGQPGYGRHLDRDGDGVGCER